MQIGVEQSEHWPLWIEVGGERYELEYRTRKPTVPERRECCLDHVWSVSTQLNGYIYEFTATTPIEAVSELAEEIANRMGIDAKRFTLDLPIRWTDLQRHFLGRGSWSQ